MNGALTRACCANTAVGANDDARGAWSCARPRRRSAAATAAIAELILTVREGSESDWMRRFEPSILENPRDNRALKICCVAECANVYETPGTTLTPPVLILRTEEEAEFEALCCGLMDEEEVAPLLNALRSNLGPKLESLNLNSSFITHDTFNELACILSDMENLPASQELRLDVELCDHFGHECLFDALHANNILAILELQVPTEDYSYGRFGYESDNDEYDDWPYKEDFDEAHHNSLLPVRPLSMAQIAAAISVVLHSSVVAQVADAALLFLIFEFARHDQARCRLVWTEASKD
ncbi:hypothetical protein FI667_g4086, partial [Globisporangium splendens]